MVRVVNELPTQGIDDVAAFEVRGVRKAEAIPTVLRWLLLGRPRIMMVEQTWGHAAFARAECCAAVAHWQDQRDTNPVSAGESLALVVRRYLAAGT
jgi:hypothetical protein